MPKRSSKKKPGPEDANELAYRIAQQATGQTEPEADQDEEPTPEDDGKNPAAVALGRLGGKKGGKARAEKLTPEERSEIAKKAAETRWKAQKK